MTWLTILLMALVIFTSRYLFLIPKLPLRLGSALEKILSYSCPAILTAIWAPIVLVNHGHIYLSLQNPYLVAAAFAVLSAWKSKNVLLTAIVSLVLFFVLKTVI